MLSSKNSDCGNLFARYEVISLEVTTQPVLEDSVKG